MGKLNPNIATLEPGVTDVFPKYSNDRDYAIGYSPNDKGRVNSDDFDQKEWSEEDVLKTGLTLRQPI